jgi:hypothetical protein
MPDFLTNSIQVFKQYKTIAEKAMVQIDETSFFAKPNEESNSIANIIQHMHGNMLSRWTDFLTTDGEKPWRHRDGEFEDKILNYSELMTLWEQGWECLFETLSTLETSDLDKTVTIRNQPQSVLEAIQRQIAHYSYHVGQIVFLCKMQLNKPWESMSIPKGK